MLRFFLFISMISSIFSFVKHTKSRGYGKWFMFMFATFSVSWIQPILMLSFCHLFIIHETFVCDMFVLLMGKPIDDKKKKKKTKIQINLTIEINLPAKNQKQIELIKHTFTNKLASILTHARYGGCRCPRRQDIIYRRVIWNLRAIRRKIQLTLDRVATRTTITTHTIEGTIHQPKYFNWKLHQYEIQFLIFFNFHLTAKSSTGAWYSTII